MKIKSLQFQNLHQEWSFEKIDFFNLTLLVGISGVGKTQILRSIDTLRRIANGNSEIAIEWDLEFKTNSGKTYEWCGKFDQVDEENKIDLEFDDELDSRPNPTIIFERIKLDGKLIVDRNGSNFLFNENKMPKLSQTESAIHILKEEDLINEAYQSFKLIVFRDHTQKENIRYQSARLDKLKKKYNTFDLIKQSDLPTIHKLALVFDINKDVFNEIKTRFIDVFPQIEDVKINPFRDPDFPNFVLEATVIQIKEKNVSKWIPQNRISSGMLRTLLHISEMFLWNDGTVILIDEFENSLGINCIDTLTEDIVFENENIQFIATSHHPYIINQIPPDYWKIVFREGSLIKTKNAKDFKINKSHHENFMSLINNPLYKKGKG